MKVEKTEEGLSTAELGKKQEETGDAVTARRFQHSTQQGLVTA